MTERIKILADKTVSGKMYPTPVKTEYDRLDLFLSPVKMSGKRVCEYILNQDFYLAAENCLAGPMSFDGSVEGDIAERPGHKNFAMVKQNFYNKPVDNLLTFEWQHSAGDFGKIINRGLIGIKEDIEKSKKAHKGDDVAVEFLDTQLDFCNAIIKRAHRGAAVALGMATETSNKDYCENLMNLSKALERIPEYPAKSFYEAVLCICFCYPFIPDSIGLIDRYLYQFYKQDIKTGTLTSQKAKEYLQEMFLMLQARIRNTDKNFYRGGASHFCVGGYLENGEDGFNELSKLIVEALMELPTWIPQISLRWTKKTPREVFRFMLDCERKDPNKRIAFVNDEPRLKGLMKYTDISYEEAVNYTMIGCNELALPGGMVFGYDPFNIVRSVENTFYKRRDDIVKVNSFEEFYAIYKEELFKDLWQAEKISKGLQDIRSRDFNIVSNIFLEGCIENAKSCTQGGLTRFIALGVPIGLSNVIDSLSVTKQFVFDEKIISLETLCDALKNNWQGYTDIRSLIMKKGNFFGNDDDCSNVIARKLFKSLAEWNNTENYLGKKWLFGNLVGYNEHHKFFGDKLKATPDGRFSGDAINFGIGQSQGKDRNGLTALLGSVAKCDPEAILTGPSVTNILIDEKLITDNENFEKTVDLLQAYFQSGGTHFQLTYVSKEDLINAKNTPEKYKNLRVRVSGFSDYFVFLNEALQDEIIARTNHS